jgi:CRISPR-associated protein Csx3
MEPFPAVFIGGPPHSGKSVLTYSLTRALRQRGVQHYVIRAAPDGEGDWANEADQALVRTLRVKGDFDPAFTDSICQSLENRHLSLIVDAGGRPTPDQERIFDCCTHAVLLTPDADALNRWRALAVRHGVPILAELTSRLRGSQSIAAVQPILQGIITGLERGQTASGPTFDALVHRLADVLYVDPDELYRFHERHCPIETVIHLDRLARTLGVAAAGDEIRWEPRHVPTVLDYLPENVPLALYGRGTNWLYTAIALLAFPAPFAHFDPRLGWAHARPLQVGSPGPETPLAFRLDESPGSVHLEILPRSAYLEYDELDTWCFPPLPAGKGLIFSGKIPYWLYTSLARTCRAAPWIAAYQPQIEGAVVVQSSDPAHPIGERVDLPVSPRNK